MENLKSPIAIDGRSHLFLGLKEFGKGYLRREPQLEGYLLYGKGGGKEQLLAFMNKIIIYYLLGRPTADGVGNL